MRLLPSPSSSVLRLMLLAGAGLVFSTACTTITNIDSAITAYSCVDNARGMRVLVDAPGVIKVFPEWGSGNVIGLPTIVSVSSTSFYVYAELDSVANGAKVAVGITTTIGGNNPAVTLSNIDFFTVPPPNFPPDPVCSVAAPPNFQVTNPPGGLIHLQIGNPSPGPLMLESLEFAQVPLLLPPRSLDWTDPNFMGLQWQSAISGPVMLDPASAPLDIQLPSVALPGTQGVLCRFASMSGGQEILGISQVDITGGTVTTQPSTWGRVKALYKN